MKEHAIRTQYATVNENGMIRHHAAKPYLPVVTAIARQLETVTNAAGDCAKQNMEWIAAYHHGRSINPISNNDLAFPQGQVVVYAQEGNNEGWMTVVGVKNYDDKAKRWDYCEPVRIKFFDRELAEQTAIALSRAFDAGNYGYDLPQENQQTIDDSHVAFDP